MHFEVLALSVDGSIASLKVHSQSRLQSTHKLYSQLRRLHCTFYRLTAQLLIFTSMHVDGLQSSKHPQTPFHVPHPNKPDSKPNQLDSISSELHPITRVIFQRLAKIRLLCGRNWKRNRRPDNENLVTALNKSPQQISSEAVTTTN